MSRIVIILIALGALTVGLFVYGHGKGTERYIPIGQSPDSGKHTLIGTLSSIDVRAQRVRLRGDGGVHSAKVTGNTRIWLDRSKLKATNVTLRLDQLRPGRRVEIRCADNECGTEVIVAEWIKVEAAADDPAADGAGARR